MIIYGFPQAAFMSVLLIPILFLQWLLFHYRLRSLSQLGESEIVVPRSKIIYWLKTLILSGIWMGAVIALMQPEGNAHYADENMVKRKVDLSNKDKRAHDVILLVDASASMRVLDSRNGISRLDYAKDIADQIISRLKGKNVALQAFTSESSQLAPLTLDYLFVRLMIRQLQINEGNIPGTDLAEVLKDAFKRYLNNSSNRLRSFILLTDGGDTLLDTEGRKEVILNPLNQADDFNLRVYTVGLGSRKGGIVPGVEFKNHAVESSLETDILQRIARRGRGEFYDTNEESSIEIAEAIAREMNINSTNEDVKNLFSGQPREKIKVYDPYYKLPLGIAILFLTFFVLFPETALSPKKMNIEST